MRIIEHNGRLWLDHDEPTDPYYRLGPQPTNVMIVRDDAIERFISLLDKPEVAAAMEQCKKENG